MREGNRVLVEVRFDHGAEAGVEDLRQAGAEVVNVSQRYQTVTVAARPADLAAIGVVARVGGVTEVLAPIVRAAGCPSGATVSEGDTQLNAAGARSSSRSTAAASPSASSPTLSTARPPRFRRPDRHPRPRRRARRRSAGDGQPLWEHRAGWRPRRLRRRRRRRGPGDGPDRPRPRPRRQHRLRHRLHRRNGLREQHPPPRRRRRQGDRRRRRLLRRALLPGRADRHRRQRSHRRRRLLLLLSRQRQPDRRSRPRHRLLGSAGIPGLRTCPAALVELSEEVEEKKNWRLGLHPRACMDFDPGDETTTFGITVAKRGDADRRPAMGRTVERGADRPRRLPDRLEERRSGGRGGIEDNVATSAPEAGRGLPVGKRNGSERRRCSWSVNRFYGGEPTTRGSSSPCCKTAAASPRPSTRNPPAGTSSGRPSSAKREPRPRSGSARSATATAPSRSATPRAVRSSTTSARSSTLRPRRRPASRSSPSPISSPPIAA